MVRETDPEKTTRAAAFALWIKAPMPMVTIFKTLDVTRLAKISRRGEYKFNALMCWCIGKAAAQTEAFYLLPAADKLMQYDSLAVSVVVPTRDGGISTCDIAFSPDLERFSEEYLTRTRQVYDTCQAYDLSGERMVIGTSALAKHEIGGAVNAYAGIYNNPFMIWGKYRRGLLKTTLPLSFQFHHAQMDGEEAARFLERLQRAICGARARQGRP